MEMASLPAVKFLFCFPYILFPTFLACNAIDDIAALTCELMFDLKCGIGGSNKDRGSKGTQLAGVAALISASCETNWCFCLVLSVVMHFCVVNGFSMPTGEGQTTLFTNFTIFVDRKI